MKRQALCLLAICLTATLSAQSSRPLPATLPELVLVLPDLTHNKQLDFGPYSDAFDRALRKDPSSVDAAIPALEQNLSDPDNDVRFRTIALLYGIEGVRRDSATLFTPLYPQLVKAITEGDPSTQAITLAVIGTLHLQAPESVAQPVEQLVKSRPASTNILYKLSPAATVVGAVGTLMAIRPNDEQAQTLVLDLLNDSTLSSGMRGAALDSAVKSGGGAKIQDFEVQAINAPSDRTLRDSAIAASSFCKLDVLNRISDQLKEIARDPNESQNVRENAQRALSLREQYLIR